MAAVIAASDSGAAAAHYQLRGVPRSPLSWKSVRAPSCGRPDRSSHIACTSFRAATKCAAPTGCWRPGDGMLCHGIRNGMQCQLCRRDLADGAPIYRFRAGRRGGATAIRCSDCAAGMTFWNWDPPSPCEGCGRPVSYRRDYRFRHHVTCGQPVCLLAVRAAAARARREPAELHCRMCGRLVPSKRPDTLYCSSPCRQRAYRRRLAAVVTPPAPPL